MGDQLENIIKAVISFGEERGWNNNKPEDLAKSIIIEAAELLEHYQWHSSKVDITKTHKEEISLEVADILFYLIAFCQRASIDMETAFFTKIELQNKKYPVSMFNGKHNEEAYRRQKNLYRQK